VKKDALRRADGGPAPWVVGQFLSGHPTQACQVEGPDDPVAGRHTGCGSTAIGEGDMGVGVLFALTAAGLAARPVVPPLDGRQR